MLSALLPCQGVVQAARAAPSPTTSAPDAATGATKFTPTPWRRSAQDVVDACRDSCERLGVDSVPLYQIHMPDIIQPGAAFGAADVRDELYWDGLAECYLQGYAQNVGVSNYRPTLMARA